MKFFNSVVDEMKQVTWSSRKQLGKDVLTVFQTTILFAIFFGVVDFGITFVMKLFL